MVTREKANPIITRYDVSPSRDDFEVTGVFNCGAVRVGKRIFLLLRVAERPLQDIPGKTVTARYSGDSGGIERIYFDTGLPGVDCSDPRTVITPEGNFITTIGQLRGAWSDDGVNFTVEREPLIAPSAVDEEYGVEDPRIVFIEGKYCITYAVVSDDGIATSLALSKDLKSVERCGIIFMSLNKDVAIFPEKIGGLYWTLHRPFSKARNPESIWTATSPDLVHWGEFRKLMVPGPEEWDIWKIGAGAPPIRTEKGWLEIYHGVDRDERYSLGAVLLDPEDPTRVLGRSKYPIMSPEEEYETNGLVGNVVFTCGAVDRGNGIIDIYYGASDDCVCLASVTIDEIIKSFYYIV